MLIVTEEGRLLADPQDSGPIDEMGLRYLEDHPDISAKIPAWCERVEVEMDGDVLTFCWEAERGDVEIAGSLTIHPDGHVGYEPLSIFIDTGYDRRWSPSAAEATARLQRLSTDLATLTELVEKAAS